MNADPAPAITRAASKQTYCTIRFLVDRPRVADAYRAYAYFRWVDDTLDADSLPPAGRLAFLERQKALLEACLNGETPRDAGVEESMLVELVHNNPEKDSALRQAQDTGLQAYLRNMLLVMEFDARRRGRLISQAELDQYTRWLAVAVTENLHYFIGHGEYTPRDERRYLAVSGAHIVHMLRDTFDDVQAGYYNVPREVLEKGGINPQDVHSDVYRQWVRGRVNLARQYLAAGREYFSEVRNARCRLACFAYIARFDWLLDVFEREDYRLRPAYDERKQVKTGLRMAWQALAFTLKAHAPATLYRPVASHRPGKP